MKCFFFFILCLPFTILGQHYNTSGEISGKVVDSIQSTPMEYVTVAVFNQKDSSLAKGAVTDRLGEFIIPSLPYGDYFAKISFIGFKTKIISGISIKNLTPDIDLGNITLSPDVAMLENVEIVAEKSAVKYEIDKKIVNVEQMNTVASATAVEVLENIPSITVDMDGNIKLRGSGGFTLLIDHQPTNMEATEALKLIPASNIKDIEIITNPSAKYNAEGTSGIINIILKKNKLDGISTLINLNGGNYNNYGGNFILSVNKGKLRLNFGGNYKNGNRYRDIYQKRIMFFENNNNTVESNGLHRFFRTNYGLNGALEWHFNRKNIFSFGINGSERQYNAAAKYYFSEYTNQVFQQNYFNDEYTLRQFYGLTFSSGFQHFFNANKKHKIAFMLMQNYQTGDEDAVTKYYDSNNQLQGSNKSTEVGPSKLMRFKIDYEKPLKKEQAIKLGVQSDWGLNKDDQNSYLLNITTNKYEKLPLFSTNVEYQQNVYAGYIIYSGKYKTKLGYQFGLRAEYTDRYIYMETIDSKTSINRLDLFPSAHFSYQKNKKDQFKASLSRRIQRPRSWNLEPFISWEDPYTVRQGNPNLLPEYIQSYELGWVRNLKKGGFSAELYYRNTVNNIERIQEVYDTNVIIKRPVNSGVSDIYGSEFSYRKRKKWWAFDLGLNTFYYKISGILSTAYFSQESFSYNVRIGNSFSLKHDWKIQFISKYTSSQANAQGQFSDYLSFDIAIKKDFWQNRLTSTFQFRNAFNTEKREYWVETSSLFSYRNAQPKWPVFSLAIALRLNNFNNKDKIKTEKGGEF